MKATIIKDETALLGRDLVVEFGGTRLTRAGEFSAGAFISKLGVPALALLSAKGFSEGQNLTGTFLAAVAIANLAAQASFNRTVEIEDYKKAEKAAPRVVKKTTPPALIA